MNVNENLVTFIYRIELLIIFRNSSKQLIVNIKPTITVSLRIQSECGKIRTRKTLNKNTFHTVLNKSISKFA